MQGPDNLNGHKTGPAGIPAEAMTDAVWDYLFLEAPYPAGCGVPEEKLLPLRKEFQYWYPMDLRVSGKDLINNHLTMSLYNHAAIWNNAPNRQVQGMYANGFVLVDNEKMSKSLGNFMTVRASLLVQRLIQGNMVLADYRRR